MQNFHIFVYKTFLQDEFSANVHRKIEIRKFRTPKLNMIISFENDLNSYLFDCIPIENIIIREALSMKQVSYELSEVCIVWFFFKSQGTTIIQIRCK